MYDAPLRCVYAAALLATLGCQTNVDAAKRSFLETYAAYSKTRTEGRPEAFSSYYAASPVHVPPGAGTNRSRAAIAEHVRDTLGLYLVGGDHVVRFSDDASMAYVYSEYVTRTDEKWGPSVGGRMVSIWQRNADGRWQCVVDVRNSADPRFRHL